MPRQGGLRAALGLALSSPAEYLQRRKTFGGGFGGALSVAALDRSGGRA